MDKTIELFPQKQNANEGRQAPAPLAERMRPRTLDEILGQDHAIGPSSPLGQMVRGEGHAIPSMILSGPPGVGKTTLARAIAASCNYRFVELSGVLDGVKELREAVNSAKEALRTERRPTLALIDEIHRFNKSQQDAFLPHIESGLLTAIGQTTENVSFRIRNALLSRMRVIELKPIEPRLLEDLIERALADLQRGLGSWNLLIDQDAKELLARTGAGDARRVLNGLEWVAALAKSKGVNTITRELVQDSYGNQPTYFDQDGDYHYDCISAFIKSMRGSDPDAALYYMIRSLDGGEDPNFITRRMIIFASEDCSCDPRALEVAVNVDRAVERVGLPEGRIPMAQAAVYLATCSKSNASYAALKEMEKIVSGHSELEIPRRLRNAPTELMRELGNNIGYRYPHDYTGAFVAERYLPEELKDLEVYKPTDRGLDQQIKVRLEEYRRLIAKAGES